MPTNHTLSDVKLFDAGLPADFDNIPLGKVLSVQVTFVGASIPTSAVETGPFMTPPPPTTTPANLVSTAATFTFQIGPFNTPNQLIRVRIKTQEALNGDYLAGITVVGKTVTPPTGGGHPPTPGA